MKSFWNYYINYIKFIYSVIVVFTYDGEILTLKINDEDDYLSLARELIDLIVTLVLFGFFTVCLQCIRRFFSQGLRIRVIS